MYKRINKKNVMLILLTLVLLFSFNKNVNAAKKVTCEYCVTEKNRGCIQLKQTTEGEYKYKYKEKRTTKKWSKVPSEIKITNPKQAISKKCPNIWWRSKNKISFITSTCNVGTCLSAYTDTLYGVEDGKKNPDENQKNKNGVYKEDVNKDLVNECKDGNCDNKSCKDILGKKLIDIIQEVVNIIRIMIPILLIVFGTMDFGKAVFLSDENEMKKAQSKFIKRVIIAVAFFITPSLLQLLLNIAANIWNIKDASFCGIKF